MRVTKNSRAARRFDGVLWLAVLLLCAASAAALQFCLARGYLLYYGDAEAHLNIARRVFDSRTPGAEQLGTVWLPLPHLLMLPLVRHDALWRTGLAGALPSAAAFVVAGAFLFAAVRRLFGLAAACAATGILATNPNLLYLQSTPMTEALFLASLCALLYFMVVYRDNHALWAPAAAGVAGCAGALIRYESWFLLPFAAAYFAVAGKRQIAAGVLFSLIALLGPLSWLAHNRFYFSDALYFYRGPYSPRAIQGGADYPGRHDWMKACIYYLTAARLCTGMPLFVIGFVGAAAAMLRRAYWPILFLALPPVFYVWSMHSSEGSPIFVPQLWPHSYYNTRYGMAWLPFAAVCVAALVAAARRFRSVLAVALVLLAVSPWLVRRELDAVVTWKESQVNSGARRAWTGRAARILSGAYRSGAGIFTSFGDLTAVYRSAGIRLEETVTGDNGPLWLGPTQRPDLFLREEWAVVMGGDPVQTAINRANRAGPYYMMVARIAEKNAPVIEIYRRSLPARFYADPIHQSPRGEERFPADVGEPSSGRRIAGHRARDL
jgi:hypothetical protein